MTSSVPLAAAAPPKRNVWLWRSLQLVATLGAFAYLAHLIDAAQLLDALRRVSAGSLLAVFALLAASLTLGALRWWLLFRAFRAPHPPGFVQLWRYYLVGFFYNTLLPGGVGGDLVRGLASRAAFGSATAGIATVLVDRALGLCGLLAVVSVVSLVHPLPILGQVWLPGVLGLAGVAALIVGLRSARALGRVAPSWLRRWLVRLPQAERWLPLAAAWGLSLLTQILPSYAGYLLLASSTPDARFKDALLFLPLAAASAYLPISVSGAGVREVLLVKLYASVGVSSSSALAMSILLWCTQALIAAFGGVHTLLWPLPSDGER
ncbi:MAG TPA: lysylphosphatidylglycerol synthase transmembrane domain-containing protein [Polyangiales bacterium]|nr:lysylphosphatidylglycerol synthase transmembrane domain-containing protein [Polyangiales bacterium]